VLVFALSCGRETDVPAGPSLVDRFATFILNDSLKVNLDSVDFSLEQTVSFSASFNKNVDWKIEVVGIESGAKKILEGFDKKIDALNASWKGSTTELPLFRREDCWAILTVPESIGFADSVLISISAPKVYDQGIVFIDFEEDYGNEIVLGNFEFDFNLDSTGILNDGRAAQGDGFYSLFGTDVVSNIPGEVSNYFVGLTLIKASINPDLTYIAFPITVPEELYFNCFMLSDGRPYGLAIIDLAFDVNNSGAFEDGVDRIYSIEIPLDWTGWRLISQPISTFLNGPETSPKSLTQEELSSIVAMRLVLISIKDQQPIPPLPVFFGIDYITFTQGGPLSL
jgi:hypothetical protein